MNEKVKKTYKKMARRLGYSSVESYFVGLKKSSFKQWQSYLTSDGRDIKEVWIIDVLVYQEEEFEKLISETSISKSYGRVIDSNFSFEKDLLKVYYVLFHSNESELWFALEPYEPMADRKLLKKIDNIKLMDKLEEQIYPFK